MPVTVVRLTRSRDAAGELIARLGVPLLDEYLEFLAGRCRPNTVLAVAYDLKVFFTVVAKPPRRVRPADVLGFMTMIPPLTRTPVRHPGRQFQQVIADRGSRDQAEGSGQAAGQITGRPGHQRPGRHRAVSGNGTIRHGEAPAGEGSIGGHLGASPYFKIRHAGRQHIVTERHITSAGDHQPGTKTILKRPCWLRCPCSDRPGIEAAFLPTSASQPCRPPLRMGTPRLRSCGLSG